MNLNHPSALPPEVAAWLETVPPPERAALVEAWEVSAHGRMRPAAPDAGRKAAVWAALEAATQAEETPAPREAGRVRPLHRARLYTLRWMSTAAAVIVLLGVGLGYFFMPVTITAPSGATRLATLPDGSQVELNSGSALTYQRAFTDRHVVLQGEGFFEVVTDGDRFVVETFNAETTVLGTRFNVRARAEEPNAATVVVVAHGCVRLDPKAAFREGVVLEAGQTSLLAARAAVPTPPDSVTLARALAWREGDLAFSNQPLGVIFSEIGRRFDVEILADAEIQQRPWSLWRHQPESAETVLADLTQSTGLRYRATANGYEVYTPAAGE